MSIKLKKNESFYIREGWFEKAINAIAEDRNRNIFYKNDGIEILGIGSNMVKGLKYWLKAANIIDASGSNALTELGELIYKYDRYLDTHFSWFFIHYYMCRNFDECPINSLFFNSSIRNFNKQNLLDYMLEELSEENINSKYLESDINVFIKSYVNEDIIYNPEDNYICPLSSLKLIKKERGEYRRIRPPYQNLEYLIVFYALQEIYDGKPFDIEESMEIKNSPMSIFNLDKYMYSQYLDEMKKKGLITINKTAGLNTVYPEKELSLQEIFELKFGGKQHV